ncbi:BTB/POZ domain-containing protein [Hirsutella rhossiliensis]|uniref:BTB/POZ domain-containing protein n=1 Tax=Hirsutella rhossiliensis TaxID=111463 RepID=A0A9P8N3C9_9HYPO|nr:BTB/POZ domain-containing protein [Hirsutella rhossiliensis]KAH0966069.1 BTB/POZ domain-containing protein [Hirsutella rhossiliensis]
MAQDPSETPVDETSTNPGGDVEMTEEGAAPEVQEVAADGSELPFAGEAHVVPPRVSFMAYLASPIVHLVVGQGEQQTMLAAHQALLVKSPFFDSACQSFVDDGSPRQIELPDEDIDAVGGFLEYLYTGEYFPKKLPGQRTLETDASLPAVDDSGDQLLKHARIYTLAEKLGVSPLKSLASSKIHCVNSTAKGEITYARYVYAHTSSNDTTVRAPIASFWATRSHMLRSEAEDEFKSLCLEYPQFGYDVLTRVLDEKLKRERSDKMHPATASARKRARHSSGAA